MINTNKKIHIYNRFRTIYTSKNRYYIRHNKKYIDLYTIIKKANLNDRQRGGGKNKDDKAFLVQELNAIKDSIVIFKLLIDDKQSEAINIYLNLIELINSKRELIINKIKTYPQNYFDNELNKSAIITYVKNMLYKNIFHDYLLNIIPRIDINNLIKETDKDTIENIIKSLLHLNNNSDLRILQDTMLKIQKYNEIIESTRKDNCTNYEALKNIIGNKIEKALEAVEEAEGADEEAEGAGGADEEAEGADEEAEGADEEAEGAEEGAKGAKEGAKGAEDGAKGAEDKPKKGKENTGKKNKVTKKKQVNKDDIKKVIDEEMIAIKEALDNLENKDYVDKLLPVLGKESEYYKMFIDSDDGVFDNDELHQYFNNIHKFLKDYNELYENYINIMNKELEEKKNDRDDKQERINTIDKYINIYENKLESLKTNLDNLNKERPDIDKEREDEEVNKAGQEEAVEAAAEDMSSVKKVSELKEKIKGFENDYADCIRNIRKIKIERNDLKKELDKIKKRIETIEKKIKQYIEFLVKINVFFETINSILTKLTEGNSRAEKNLQEYSNITLYKNYIENIIFNIKTKILYYFIANYIVFCKDLNECKKVNNKKGESYDKLKGLIETLDEKKESDKSKAIATQAHTGPAASVPNPIAGAVHVVASAAPVVAPGALAPGALAPGALAPGALAPGALAPGALAPGALAPVVASGAAAAPVVVLNGFGGFGDAVPVTGGKGKPSVCAYLTDVEGNLDFFEKYVRISKVIEWVDSKKNRLRFKQKDSMFVFGGDCQDRGIGDIRFVNLLLKFKDEYPDRVEFIIGNRDANKIRIYSEMSEKIDSGDLKAKSKYLAKYDNFPYWVNKGERITLRKYLNDNNLKINAVSRLKYILDYTMGSNDSFVKRRKELSIILNKSPDSISDNDIVTSFLNSVSPNPKNIKNTNDNYMLKYLKNGKIAYIFGEHIFVHGAVNKNNIGYIPNNKNIVDDVGKWVYGLNKWFQKDLKEYMANPEYGGISKKRKGYKIIDYAVPSDNKTVVYSDNLKNGNGRYINVKVIKYLNKGGVHSIISGHRPHGDCPLVLRSKKLTAVSADTSYSKMGHRSKWGIDNRGNAVSEVLLYLNGDIRTHGILQDNQKYDYIIKNKEVKPANTGKPDKSAPKYDKYVGLQLKNNYWVKNVRYDKNAKSAKYLISYAKGFEYDDKWITETEMLKLL